MDAQQIRAHQGAGAPSYPKRRKHGAGGRGGFRARVPSRVGGASGRRQPDGGSVTSAPDDAAAPILRLAIWRAGSELPAEGLRYPSHTAPFQSGMRCGLCVGVFGAIQSLLLQKLRQRRTQIVDLRARRRLHQPNRRPPAPTGLRPAHGARSHVGTWLPRQGMLQRLLHGQVPGQPIFARLVHENVWLRHRPFALERGAGPSPPSSDAPRWRSGTQRELGSTLFDDRQ